MKNQIFLSGGESFIYRIGSLQLVVTSLHSYSLAFWRVGKNELVEVLVGVS